MATFAQRINALSGIDLEAEGKETYYNQWLTDAANDVINTLPPQILYIASKTQTVLPPVLGGVADSHTTVPQSRILGVERMHAVGHPQYECREIPFTDRGKANANSGYMEEATAESPVFFRLNNAIYILPLLTDTQAGSAFGFVTYVDYPTVEYTDTSIPKFPDEIEQLVALKAAVSAKFWQISEANKEEDIEIATSHTNHMSAINQEYTMCLQNFMNGFQINAKEQGAGA